MTTPSHFVYLGAAFITLSLSSCLSLGQKSLPEGPETPQYSLAPCRHASQDTAATSPTPFTIEAKQLPLQVRSTAKTPWNTHLRYVYPYTKNTVQFEVSVSRALATNSAEQTIGLAETVLLQSSSGGPPVASLPFSYWQKVWPANAARSAQELHDRSIAMGEVIQQRWQSRRLYAGESYTALVVFPLSVLSQSPEKLIFSYETASKAETFSLCLTPRVSSTTQ